MLRITASRSASGATSYFKEGLVKGDYYALGEDAKGKWGGLAAERLGLVGEVDAKDFAALCHNQKPDGSKLNPRNSTTRKCGYDFTFSVPKSVSVAYAITDDQRIKHAFEQSVKETMQEVETQMRTQTGQGTNKYHQRTGNMVWAGFTHQTSRPVDGIADPHLHRHCFVMNTTWNEAKQRFQAGEFGTLKKTAPYYEAAFHARMASKLKQMGYGIEKRGYAYELKGIHSPTLAKFSRRTVEVEKAVGASATPLSSKQKEKLGALTRAKKMVGMSWQKLRSVWRSWLSDEETRQIERADKEQQHSKWTGEKTKEVSAKESLALACEHLFERKSVVAEYQLRAEALKRGYGDVLPETIGEEIGQQKFYRQERRYVNYLTNDEALQAENKMLAYVREGKGSQAPLHPFYRPKADYLNQEQRGAVAHALRDTNHVTLISGGAGVGKTSLVKEIQTAMDEKNVPFVGVAPSAAASRGVMRKEGFSKADTLSRLLVDPKFQAEAKNGVIWVDEAGLVGVKDMNRLFAVAKQQNARLLLTGDVNQHSSVAAGDALRILEKEGRIKVARVREIQRQKNSPQFKKVVAQAAKGNADAALYQLDKIGGVMEIADSQERQAALVNHYIETHKQGKTALIISPTHAEGNQVTNDLRARLKQEGLLEKQEREFTQLKSTNWTKEYRSDVKHYYEQPQALTLEFHQNGKGHQKGERWQCTPQQQLNLHVVTATKQGEAAPQQVALSTAERFTVYREQSLKLAKGDRIRITKGGKTKEGTRINNGDSFTVKGFTKKGDIRLHMGKVLAKEFGHIAYGYTTTSHSSQGKTVSKVLIAQSSQSAPAASAEQFYVSISRAKDKAIIFTDDKKALEQSVKHSGKRMTARELAYQQAYDQQRHKHRAQRKAKAASQTQRKSTHPSPNRSREL